MSDMIAAAVEALNAKLDGAGLDGSAKFEIEGEGAIRLDENGASADDSDADVTMIADAETFKGILSGDVDPTGAFMSGSLKIEGDMGMAMKLASVLS
ncbi:MAG: SCP2 sterol-binding domain-containing protein [Pseudomonadota bacterium]